MAQTAAMGPPLSPRETRRSGRRSAPSVSTSTSKSPDSPPPDSVKEKPHRPSLTSSNSNGRNRRFKQEDTEDSVDEPKSAVSNGSAATHGNTNGRAKRKGKEKEKPSIIPETLVDIAATKSKLKVVGDEALADQPEEEEQGITRCVCGSTGEDDPDAGEFMVQCETCKVWQHGLCMGYESEDQLHDDDYYCEQCRPEQHQELLKKLTKRGRHSSANSHHNSATAASRLSRSHSPSYLLKPSKRRNTMNSRDAAFDESLKEIIEATAAEAAAINDSRSVTSNGHANGHVEPEENAEAGPSSRKKRKRSDDDAVPKKRTRSASSASDRPAGTHIRDETPVTASGSKTASIPVPTLKSTARNKRGGVRKVATHEPALSVEGDEGAPPPTKRQALNSRAKAAVPARRAPVSTASHVPGNATHEHGTRRNQSNGANGANAYGNTSAEASRAYRNSHAYAVSQQPLFTSWNLPDYLSHLEPMLPSDTPRPLEVRGSGVGPGGRESVEKAVERGVKVKWPSKRMSVGDMNKRVRALVEWVGREQASALDRGRRKDALMKALKKGPDGSPFEIASMDTHSVLDSTIPMECPSHEKTQTRSMGLTSLITVDSAYAGLMSQSPTMKEMERLMEELISFQERFGPGAKNRERHSERRQAVA